MNSLGNILYLCTLLHIICEHLHDLYTLNSLSGWKGLKKCIPRDSLNSPLIYILFSMIISLCLSLNVLQVYKIMLTRCLLHLYKSIYIYIYIYITRRQGLYKEIYILPEGRDYMNISIYYQKAGIMNVSNGSKASTRRDQVVGGFKARQLTYPRDFNIKYRVSQ